MQIGNENSIFAGNSLTVNGKIRCTLNAIKRIVLLKIDVDSKVCVRKISVEFFMKSPGVRDRGDTKMIIRTKGYHWTRDHLMTNTNLVQTFRTKESGVLTGDTVKWLRNRKT